MSDAAYVTLSVIAVAGLALIPIVMVARVVLAVVAESRNARANEARGVKRHVPGLGDLSSTDDELWVGAVSGLRVALRSRGQPPSAKQADQVRAIIGDLPRLIEKARAYLRSHENCDWLEGGVARFRPYSIEPEDASSFTLELVHPADADGVYRVTFRNGEPVASGRDD